MADTSHHNPSEVLPYHEADEHAKRRSAPVALTVIAIMLALAAAALTYKLKQQEATSVDLRAQLAQANSANDVAKADLASANAKGADLQAQLEKSTSAQAGMQVQLKQSEELSATTQAQLEQTQAELKSLQEKSAAQSSEFQSQLGVANESATALRAELATAKSQIADLNGQLTKAKTDVVAAPQEVAAVPPKTLPLTTEFKKAFFSGNYSLQIKNPSADAMNLDIGITGSDQTPSRTATIEPGGTLKIDGLAAGANITIKSEGFQTLTLIAQ